MSHDPFDLSGRRALITGAAGLLGAEHAVALLESHADLLLTDIDNEALAALRDRLAAVYPDRDVAMSRLDVTDADAVARLAETAAVQILINNAALDPKVKGDQGPPPGRLETFPLDLWSREIAVGLTGAFLCAQAFGRRMAPGGVILNIASDLAVIAPDQRLYRREGLAEDQQPVKPVTYSVIKTGLVGLTRYLATYWADRGIRVNALSPGGVEAGQSADFVARLGRLVPLGRMARRDEYRSAIRFLCSDASSYMTGQNVVMDGGRSVW